MFGRFAASVHDELGERDRMRAGVDDVPDEVGARLGAVQPEVDVDAVGIEQAVGVTPEQITAKRTNGNGGKYLRHEPALLSENLRSGSVVTADLVPITCA